MEVSGIVKRISDVQQVSQSFRKREIVLTTEEQYPQHLSIEFVQDKCELLDQFQDGQKVTISINLRGRECTSPQGEVKYFNSIQGWRIVAATNTHLLPPRCQVPQALTKEERNPSLVVHRTLLRACLLLMSKKTTYPFK